MPPPPSYTTSRHTSQCCAYGREYESTLGYYKRLNGEFDCPDDVLEAFVGGMAALPDHFKRLGVEEPCVWSEYLANTPQDEIDKTVAFLYSMGSPEHPELGGDVQMDTITAHVGVSDAAFYLAAHDTVETTEEIDVWFESPARHLIIDTEGLVTGVQVERDGQLINIGAIDGVVLACGGFECNPTMIRNYLGLPTAVPKGGLYNKGDGIRMAQEIGADLWHMNNYETFGICGSYVWAVPEGERCAMTTYPLYAGPFICVAEDGSRFANEGLLVSRHGVVYDHGLWVTPKTSFNPHLVCTAEYLEKLRKSTVAPANLDELLLSAETANELAELIGADPQILTDTLARYNEYVETGIDIDCNRPADTMAPIEGPLYALPMAPAILNTQGGPRRNGNAQVVDVNGNPIPHLFSAGECGGFTAHLYQGGSNVAECLIFGSLAGTNAVKGV